MRGKGRPGFGAGYTQVRIYLPVEDYRFLKEVAGTANMAFSQLAREMLIDLAGLFRQSMRDVKDLQERAGQEIFVRRIVRQALLRMAEALEEGQ